MVFFLKERRPPGGFHEEATGAGLSREGPSAWGWQARAGQEGRGDWPRQRGGASCWEGGPGLAWNAGESWRFAGEWRVGAEGSRGRP